MAFLIQASANVPDWDSFEKACDWLHEQFDPPPPGFLTFRVMRGADDPSRMTILEEWESQEQFQEAFAKYDQTHRMEFLDRAGISADSFERALWNESGIEVRRGG